MQKNICIAQNIRELKFILKNIRKNLSIVPLNLETYLYCLEKKLNFLDPKNFISNNFHRRTLIQAENLSRKIEFTKLIDINIKTEVITFMRFRYYSYKYLFQILKFLKKKYKSYKIYISGWSTDNHFSVHEFIVSDIVKMIEHHSNISIVKNYADLLTESKIYEYNFESVSDSTANKKVLLNNLGYNFKRLVFSKFKSNINYYVPTFQRKNFLLNFLYSILNIKYIFFKKKEIVKKKIYKNIFYLGKTDKKTQKVFNFFKKKSDYYFMDLFQKNISIKKLIKKFKFDLILSNISKGEHGAITSKVDGKKTNSICITHGTVAESFNKFDRIYKQNIAKAVFSGDSKFFAIQTKIAKKSLRTHKLSGKSFITGNLLFSQPAKKLNSFNKKVLCAFTLKDFCNLQFLGVEMYYEFYENLKFFNYISLKSKHDFLIKLHPSEDKCKKSLKKIFPNLIFTSKKIEKVLSQSFVTVSFSSTVIEDSLNSLVPVILFDPWKRYQHCDAEKKYNINGKAIYYINKRINLLKTIKTIKDSDHFNFDNYIYNSEAKSNFKNNIISKI